MEGRLSLKAKCMKTLSLMVAVAGLAGVGMMSGCSSTGGHAPTSQGGGVAPTEQEREEHRGDRSEWNKEPEVGMTKEQVRQRYGAPRSVEQKGNGEVWVYRPRRSGRDFIPVYGGFTHQYKGGVIGFDAKGHVNGYEWGTKRWSTWW